MKWGPLPLRGWAFENTVSLLAAYAVYHVTTSGRWQRIGDGDLLTMATMRLLCGRAPVTNSEGDPISWITHKVLVKGMDSATILIGLSSDSCSPILLGKTLSKSNNSWSFQNSCWDNIKAARQEASNNLFPIVLTGTHFSQTNWKWHRATGWAAPLPQHRETNELCYESNKMRTQGTHAGLEAKAPSSDTAFADGEMESSSVSVLRPDSRAWSPQMIEPDRVIFQYLFFVTCFSW